VLSVLERSAGAVETLLGAVPRVVALLDQAEALLERADAMVARTEETRAAASVVVARTDETVTLAAALLDRLEPPLTTLQPTLERLAETTDPAEVDALVRLVDQLPRLTEELETHVLPILESMGTVAPDLHDLLDVSRELNEMLTQVPGISRMKRRIDKEQAAEARGEPRD